MIEFLETLLLVLGYVAALGFLVSGVDDLVFDSFFLRYLLRHRRQTILPLTQLRLAPEQWVALFVPAWQEGGVVNKMAEYADRVVRYEKYDIFIGVYPNDPETNACVDRLCATHPRIHKVSVPHPGPTSKADCLNWIYRGMRRQEVPGVREYAVIAIHDAEDVIHPLALKVYSYFVPAYYDMAQLPVFALELPAFRHWVGNTYIDDFAELHTKDLFIRETIGGIVPSAGVGTAFARAVLERLAADNDGDPFRVGNLTEDYEIGIRVKRAGFRTGVVSYPVERIVRQPRRDGTPGEPRTVTEIVAIRENFPRVMAAAIRQRSRWILGISFQTWEQAGWSGTWPMRYTLFRDRRAPLTHLVNMIGYAVLGLISAQWLFQLTPWGERLFIRPLLRPDSFLWTLALIDTALLGYRCAQKFISVAAIYNLKQAFCSIPRLVLSNLINFFATVRAARMYFAYRLFGQPVVWLKTSHVFPGDAELSEYRKTIEDLLVEEGLVTREQIFQALKLEKVGSAPLCLLRMGLLSEQQFTEVWSRHSTLGIRFANPYTAPAELLVRFPENRAAELEAFPLEAGAGSLLFGFREPPGDATLQALGRSLGTPVHPILVPPSSLAYARSAAYPGLLLRGAPIVAWAHRFADATNLEPGVLLEALSSQHAARRQLPDLVVDMGLMLPADANRVWAQCLGCAPHAGTTTDLDQALLPRASRALWWLHQTLPLEHERLLTCLKPHPGLARWLRTTTGIQARFFAELPARLNRALQRAQLDLDPDQLFLEHLARKGWLRPEDLPDLPTLRSIIAEPLPRWLRLQKLLTEEQLHQVFLEAAGLPPAGEWNAAEVRRLSTLLPPGFAAEHKCFVLEVSNEGIRLGLAQLPSVAALGELRTRLAGHPVLFQSVGLNEAAALDSIVGGH